MAGRKTFFFEGLGVSRGIVIGPAFVLETAKSLQTEAYDLDEEEITQEVNRFRKALELARDEIRQIKKEVEEKIDRQQASIFDAHLMMLEDPFIIETTEKKIQKENRNAESILWEVIQDLGNQMKALGDEFFAERNHDLYDVGRRVIKFLVHINKEDTPEINKEGAIIVAKDLGPAETAQFSRENVLGFCVDEGGPTSHTTIVAKALGIPAIVGIENIVKFIRTGDMLILDGNNGRLILNPTEQQLVHYRQLSEEFKVSQQVLSEIRCLPAITQDEQTVSIQANLELPQELEIVQLEGCEGVGLFRTEFLYLDRDDLPTEEEHEDAYRRVYEKLGKLPVTMRTLDLGGDKMPKQSLSPYMEANPFMGLRAIRLCVTKPEILRTQLKAMIKAAAGRKLYIMIPMVSGLEEFRFSREMLDALLKVCANEGHQPPSEAKLGAMIEIPSAALQANELAQEADFLSIGTNDLVQYSLAVDRINKSVTNLYKPTHPAVLRLIKMTVDAGKAHGKMVSVCGEMASNHVHALLLIGLGVRSLSMSPNSVGMVKRAIREFSMSLAEEMAQQALSCKTYDQVDAILAQHTNILEQAIS